MKIEWKEEYSVGVKKIDEQHKKMLNLISELKELLYEVDNTNEMRDLIQELIDYGRYHFATEESYFEQTNYPKKLTHQAYHGDYNEKISEFQQKYSKEKTVKIAFEIADFLEEWWINHIRYEDMKYMDWFKEHGIS